MHDILLYLIPILLLVTAGLIWVLHRNQQRNALEIAERSAPLPGVEESSLTELRQEPEQEPGAGNGEELRSNWQLELRALKEQGNLDEAIAVCRAHFPRMQAFQQAAVIHRQQIRLAIESQAPVNTILEALYRVAVLADLYRSDNPIRPTDPDATLEMLEPHAFPYKDIGFRHLKLLNKSDIRHLQQLWGNPERHRHGEEALGETWALACMARTGR
jgi:hypothetical protein